MRTWILTWPAKKRGFLSLAATPIHTKVSAGQARMLSELNRARLRSEMLDKPDDAAGWVSRDRLMQVNSEDYIVQPDTVIKGLYLMKRAIREAAKKSGMDTPYLFESAAGIGYRTIAGVEIIEESEQSLAEAKSLQEFVSQSWDESLRFVPRHTWLRLSQIIAALVPDELHDSISLKRVLSTAFPSVPIDILVDILTRRSGGHGGF